MTDKEKTFQVKDLDLYYGTFQALKKINIDIYEKDITALIGPSGCGKSTFLRTLNRMNDLVEGCRIEGSVLFDGEDIYDKDYDLINLRKRAGMVFQNPILFPRPFMKTLPTGPKFMEKKTRASWTKSSNVRCAR